MSSTIPTIRPNTPVAAWFGDLRSKACDSGKVLVDTIGRRLAEIVQTDSPGELLKQIAEIVAANTKCIGLWIATLRPESEGRLTFRPLISPSRGEFWNSVQDQFHQAAVASCQSGDCRQFQFSRAQLQAAIVTPAWSGAQCDELIAGCFELDTAEDDKPRMLLLAAAQTLALWRARRTVQSVSSLNILLQRFAHTLQSVSKAENRKQAAIALTNHMKHLLGLEHAVLASFPQGRPAQIEAISDVDALDLRNEFGLRLASCFERLRKEKLPLDSRTCGQEQHSAIDDYQKLVGAPAAVYLPFPSASGSTGGILGSIANATSDSANSNEIKVFFAESLAVVWNVVQRSHTPWHLAAVREMRNKAGKFWRRRPLLVTVALVLVILCPFPYRVATDCQLQPVQRRFIAAPFEGVLECVNVRGGDIVQKNQILATMDADVLEMELAGLEAQLAAAQKKRDSSLAGGSIAESQIAKSESKRFEAQINLVKSKLERLEIRSPIAGVVVSGDMDKVEGARLEMGQSLFEVAPLESMLVEILVPETDVRHVRVGQTATMKFSSQPFRKWQGVITRVHPKSEIVDENNVFVAEVALDNADALLRPGMKGKSKVSSGWRPLAWIWLHHAWERVRYAFVW